MGGAPRGRGRRSVASWGLLLAWSTVLFALSSRPLPEPLSHLPRGGDKLAHGAAWAGWASLAWSAAGAAWPGARARWRAVLVFGAAVAWGALDEVHQAFVPGRTPDGLDVLADAAGALLAIGLLLACSRRRAPPGPSRSARSE